MQPEHAAETPEQMSDPAPASPPPGPDPVIQRQLAEVQAQNQYLHGQVQQIGAWAQSEAQARQEAQRTAREARIANLPPQDQAIEIARLAREENAQLRQFLAQSYQPRQAAPQVADRNSEQLTPAQVDAAKRELVATHNRDLGLSGERAIKVEDIAPAYQEDQIAFVAALKDLGERRRSQPAEQEAPDMAKQRAAPPRTGANRPMTPQPNAPGRAVDAADFNRVLSDTSVKTPQQRVKQLAQLREEAAAKLQR